MAIVSGFVPPTPLWVAWLSPDRAMVSFKWIFPSPRSTGARRPETLMAATGADWPGCSLTRLWGENCTTVTADETCTSTASNQYIALSPARTRNV